MRISDWSSDVCSSDLVDQITAKVMAGDWTAGQSLPSIRELAAASRVSVITVRRAYEELERAGVIATRQGKGSVVAERSDLPTAQIGRASCRERVCQYV